MGRPTDKPESLNRGDRPANRRSITGYTDKLTVEGQEPGYHYCWVNDDKVARFERASYEFVTHECIVGDVKIAACAPGAKISMPVGNGVTGYLMRVQEEFYNSDMDLIQTDIDEKERDMYRNLNSHSDGSYGKVELAGAERVRVKRN